MSCSAFERHANNVVQQAIKRDRIGMRGLFVAVNLVVGGTLFPFVPPPYPPVIVYVSWNRFSVPQLYLDNYVVQITDEELIMQHFCCVP